MKKRKVLKKDPLQQESWFHAQGLVKILDLSRNSDRIKLGYVDPLQSLSVFDHE